MGKPQELIEALRKSASRVNTCAHTKVSAPSPALRQQRRVSVADYAKVVRALGANSFLFSSDLGQYLSPLQTDGLKAFIIGLRDEGISEADSYLMARHHPAPLLAVGEVGRTHTPRVMGWVQFSNLAHAC